MSIGSPPIAPAGTGADAAGERDRRRHSLRHRVAAGAAAVAVGCAVAVLVGRDGTSDAGPPVDACRLVAAADARAALGQNVVRRREAGSCSFIQKGRLRAISVTIVPERLRDKAFGEDVERFAHRVGARRQRVRGIGDEAYAIVKPSIAQLQARRGDAVFAVVLLNVERDEKAAMRLLTELGRKASARFG